MSTEVSLLSLRAQLESDRTQLEQQLREMGIGDATSGLSFDANFADTSQVTAERGELDALATSLSETLADVRRALDKLDGGTFGVCEQCEGEIPLQRLEAMPTARLCMNCASRA